MYLAALCSAFERIDDADGQEQLVELSQRIASAYAGFVRNATEAVAIIVRGGIKYALQVWASDASIADTRQDCYTLL